MAQEANEMLNFTIYKTNILLKGHLQKTLKSFDLTSEQWIVLKCLDDNEVMNQKELAQKVFKEKAVITRILNGLEDKGFIERQKSLHDKREFIILLTDQGQKTYTETLDAIEDYKKWLKRQLTPEESNQLSSLLQKLNDQISQNG